MGTRKYSVIIRQSISYSIAYRLQIILQIAQSFLTPLLLLAALFSAVPDPSVSLAGLLPYYFFVSLIYPLVVSNIDQEIETLSVSGDINNFLTKPLPLFRYLLFKNLGEKLTVAAIVLPAIIAASLVSHTGSFWIAAASLPISFLLSFCFSYFVGLFSFWVDEFWAVHNLKFVLIQFFGGIAVPLSFFPEKFSAILVLTPFPYFVSWAARIAQNDYNLLEFFIASSWVVILYLACSLMEKFTIRKYSFTGG